MTAYGSLVCEEIEATIVRAGLEDLTLGAFRVDVTDSFRRRHGECRVVAPTDRETTEKYEIRIARRLFEDKGDEKWRDTVRHEIAHAYVLKTVGSEVKPHGEEWKDAALRVGADPVARYEGDDTVDATYVLACPNGCFERGYLQRAKRVKQPWLYTCDECGTSPSSYDVGNRPPAPDPEPVTWRAFRGRHNTTGTARTTGVVPPGTCSPVRTAVRRGRISSAQSGSRTRGCISARSARRHSSVATSTTNLPTSIRGAVTWRASPGRNRNSSTLARMGVSMWDTGNRPRRADSPSATGVRSVAREPLPIRPTTTPNPSNRERPTSDDCTVTLR